MARFTRFAIIFIVVIAAAVFFLNMAKAQGDVRIVFLEGNPKIMKAGINIWDPCVLDMAVSSGDRIKTREGESVEITFAKKNSNVMRIEPGSDVFIKKSESPYSIELLNGTAMALIKDLPKGSTFEIRTPFGLSGARATGWIASTDGAAALFGAFEDSIYAAILDENGNVKGDMVTVMEGWKAILEKDKAIMLERLAAGDIQRWNEWRQDVLNRLGISSIVNLDTAGGVGDPINRLESKKDDINELRDIGRIESRDKTEYVAPNDTQRGY